MYFYPDSTITVSELKAGMFHFFEPFDNYLPPEMQQLIKNVFIRLKGIKKDWWTNEFVSIKNLEDLKIHWQVWGLKDFNPERSITRRELAVWLDRCFNLFDKKIRVDHYGKYAYEANAR